MQQGLGEAGRVAVNSAKAGVGFRKTLELFNPQTHIY